MDVVILWLAQERDTSAENGQRDASAENGQRDALSAGV